MTKNTILIIFLDFESGVTSFKGPGCVKLNLESANTNIANIKLIKNNTTNATYDAYL